MVSWSRALVVMRAGEAGPAPTTGLVGGDACVARLPSRDAYLQMPVSSQLGAILLLPSVNA